MVIYTRKGDKGKTSLYGDPAHPKRVSKGESRILALGAIDQANSFLGLVSSFLTDRTAARRIKKVQINLLIISSILAGANLSFSSAKTRTLEKQIDRMDKVLPKLRNFVIPGGCQTAAFVQVARTLAREAEREVVRTLGKDRRRGVTIALNKRNALKYLNRLSDYLFTLARVENYEANIKDEIWKVSS